MSDFTFGRTREEVLTAPDIDDFCIEHWSVTSDATVPFYYELAVMRLETPEEIRKIDLSRLAAAVGGNRMRINRYVGEGVEGSYGGWRSEGVWSPETGALWND